MLSEVNQKELNDLRHDSDSLKHRIRILQNDIEDADYEIQYLNKWKRGRWTGFVVALIINAICMGVEYFYITIQGNAVGERLSNKAAALEFAVSSTVIAFFTTLLIFVSLITLRLGIKVVLELGSSHGARGLAKVFGEKNYYNFVEDHLNRKNAFQKELLSLQREKGEIDRRIEELEKDEDPWEFR